MRTVALGDLIVAARAARAGSRSYPLLSMTMHDGLIDQAAKFKKRVASQDVADYKVVRRGQLVVGFPIDEAVLDFQGLYDEGIVSPAYNVWDLKSENAADRAYLKRYLRSPRAVAYYKAKLRSTTARRRSLPRAEFLAHPIPLPPLDEQRRIAAILDHADAIRAKRRQMLAHLDDLTQSIFHDMFGDPDEAEAVVPFVEIASLKGGRNLVADDAKADAPYKVLKISAVTSGRFKPNEAKALPTDYQPPADHLVRPGDLLMSRANTTELVGAVAHVHDVMTNIALPDKIWRFEWRDDRSVPLFYRELLRHPSIRRRISRMSSGTGGSMKNISKSKLNMLPLPAVSLDKQRKFADRVSAIPAPNDIVIDELFASLQSRAFKGGL